MNEKKFPEKKLLKKSLLAYVEKKGFYIVLILCVAIIGATAVFLSTTKVSTPNSEYNANIVPEVDENAMTAVDKNQTGISSKDNAPVSNATANEPTVKSQTVQEDVAKGAEKAPKTTPVPTKSPTKKVIVKEPQKFIMPVFGEISFNYAEDELAYSKTLEEWRTHQGLDLTAERGTAVIAVADGIVSEVKNDPRFGITIILDHQNGFKTLYANLASDDMVTPNQKIKQGDVIGAIGATATIEAAEQAHLHFEVWKQDNPVNPEAYLAIK